MFRYCSVQPFLFTEDASAEIEDLNRGAETAAGWDVEDPWDVSWEPESERQCESAQSGRGSSSLPGPMPVSNPGSKAGSQLKPSGSKFNSGVGRGGMAYGAAGWAPLQNQVICTL